MDPRLQYDGAVFSLTAAQGHSHLEVARGYNDLIATRTWREARRMGQDLAEKARLPRIVLPIIVHPVILLLKGERVEPRVP